MNTKPKSPSLSCHQPKDRPTHCHRCGGFLVEAWFFDDFGEQPWIIGQRCINCGDIQESLVTQNRHKATLPPKVGRPARRLYKDVLVLRKGS